MTSLEKGERPDWAPTPPPADPERSLVKRVLIIWAVVGVAAAFFSLVAWGVVDSRRQQRETNQQQITACQQGGGSVKIGSDGWFDSCIYPPVPR